MFYTFFLRSFRLLLLPFSILFWLVLYFRSLLYQKKWLRSATFGIPLITVGNLAVGGTGKSPLIEYLIELLQYNYQLATLSRGYRRRTKGYAFAKPEVTALEIGDEPLMLYRKFPNVAVAVGEERLLAIPELLHDFPSTEVILLDDAFQHRAIQAGFTILLTEHANLFSRDFYLPTGDLRDLKSRYKEADVIIVTKCDPALSGDQQKSIIDELKPGTTQKVFFTKLNYGVPYHLITKKQIQFKDNTEVLLVTGISNPTPLKKWVEHHSAYYRQLQFRDHHIFTAEDLKEILLEFKKINTENGILLTTEKDAVRLEKFEKTIQELPFYVIPVCHEFMFDQKTEFDDCVINFITNFRRSS
ncbi:MAG: tetraacyldisaccharide 4'-kinase [Bacteroidetes bacterium]|nr:tetraacyldisaccharide 4'-kinase [Bacteroidota bacterium]